MTTKRPMTPRGYDTLTQELYRLKNVERPTLIEEIKVARSHGDLSENAEYQFAKEKQSHVEGRILEVEGMLASAEVIDPAKVRSDRVLFGATVRLYEHGTEETHLYTIVGEHEADVDRGLLSVTSPLGKALLGKQDGDEVTLKMPKTTRTFDVESIEYLPFGK